jgi:hypothetical protein
MRVVAYRLRTTLWRRVGGLLAIVILVGLTGGIALGSIAAARRTQSAYPKFLASTNPSVMTVSAFSGTGGGTASLQSIIGRLPQVRRVRELDVIGVTPLTKSGAPDSSEVPNVFAIGSSDGEILEQDRVTPTEGRVFDPARPDEAVVTSSAARQLHVHVGSLLPLGVFPDRANPLDVLQRTVKVVGVVALDNELVQDDIDATFGFLVLTPALLHQVAAVAPGAVSPTTYGLQLEHRARDVTPVERQLVKLIPPGQQYEFHAVAPVVAQTEDAIKPESVAIGAFGATAALVALVVAAQAISRQLRAGDEERGVLRALGAGPFMTAADGLLSVLIAVVVGALLAVVVALALSPVAPLGPVRPVYPTPGIAFDATVLGFGFAVLVVALGMTAMLIAYRRAPHRLARRRELGIAFGHPSRVASAAVNSGMSAPAVAGIRFAFEPGEGPTAVPMRSTLLGTVVAVALLVATITFASGLQTLVSHPALYGWNWTYQITPTQEVPPITRTLLAHDHTVAQWTPMRYVESEIDGVSVPILLGTVKAKIAPPVLSGHGLDSDRDIVMGATTLARLHKHVGDSVVVSYRAPADAPAYVPPTRLRIVGTATFPAVGFTSFVADHTSMGTGALVSFDVEPVAFRQAQLQPDPNMNGPDLVFVRMRDGVSASRGRADMQRIVRATDKVLTADPNTLGTNVIVQGVQRPAQIVNYKTIGAAPVLLAAGLAVGAIIALALTLTASVRRRRRDLALLKTLGFTRRQLAASIAWQASVAALVGVVVGVPFGILVGRWLWTEFAREISALPRPTVPALAVLGVAVGTLVLANIVAAFPGRQASRTRSAVLLQAE